MEQSRELEELKVAARAAADIYEAEITRLRAALERICSVHLGESQLIEPDWMARLMQGIASEALAHPGGDST